MTRNWKTRLLDALIVIAISMIIWGTDYLVSAAEKRENIKTGKNWVARGITDFATAYQLFLNLPVSPEPEFTVLVKLSEETNPPNTMTGCIVRKLEGRILETLSRSNATPSVVVLDQNYHLTNCDLTGPETTVLYSGVRSLCALKNVNVVVGRRYLEPDRVAALDHEMLWSRSSQPILPLDVAIPFPEPENACVAEGLLSPYPDPRRIGLFWPDPSKPDQPMRSLALAAAMRYQNGALTSNERLEKLNGGSDPPFATFFKKEQFADRTIPAKDLLCPDTAPERWRACSPAELTDPIKRAIRGKIVVIGWDIPSEDRWTPAGMLPGYMLHANYIESLLNPQSLFWPVRERIDVGSGIAIFLLFMFFLERSESERAAGRKPLRYLTLALSVLPATLLLAFAVAKFSHFYWNPLTGGITGMFLEAGKVIIVRYRRKTDDESRPAPSQDHIESNGVHGGAPATRLDFPEGLE